MRTLKQLSFVGGELTPSLYGRTDQAKYQTGARTMLNYFIMRHGGISNRPGTQFIAETANSSDVSRLIEFVFSTDQTYIIEMGEQYLRFYRNGTLLSDISASISGITEANPAVVTTTAPHSFTTGDEVAISGVEGVMSSFINGRNFKITVLTTTTFSLQYNDGTTNVDSTSWGSATATTGTAARIYEISSPYASSDIFDIKFVQSADVITLAHPNYAPRELSRSGHTNWTLATITFAPAQAAPTSVTNSSTGTGGDKWVVTAINDENFEESLASSETESSTAATSGSPITVSWTGASGATEYYVYKELNGIFGFIGIASGTSFVDNGISPDTQDTPPKARNPFYASNDYPSAVGYIQQRLTFANTNNDPEKIWMSRSGNYKNFTTSTPLQSDDAVTFSVVGSQVNEVRNILDLGSFISLTEAGEWSILGNAAGTITPTEINPKQNSYNGSSNLSPIIVANTALYVQARGSIIRDLIYSFQENGYSGNDLTIFSAHLFDGHTIVDWGYQKTPHSIVWAVRDDGVLLALTYIREHQIWGWTRCTTDGLVKSVAVIPEGDEDVPYFVIQRTINGNTVKYVEKFNTRYIDSANIEDIVLMDSTLSFDGNHAGATTMTLSGGTNWTYDETITLTASVSYFDSSMVNDQIHLTDSAGEIIRFTIEAYSSATVVTGKPNRTVPATLRGSAASSWGRAIKELTGLWHLEGENLAIYADRFVVGSPNNAAYTTYTVSNGSVTLSEHHVVIHVGLPYFQDLELLDIDTAQGESIVGENKTVREVTVQLEASRGVWVGPRPPTDDSTDPLENLTELKIREDEGYDDPVSLTTDAVTISIETEWNSNGRIFIRQVDPVPLSILSVTAHGVFPFTTKEA